MTFEPGQTVDERFRVGRRMGGNVHGSTCKAKSLLSDREVVLKKLHHDPDQGMQQQLLQAQQAQQLSRDCDQLLMIDEVSVDGEDVFCVLPFLPARSLKRQKPPEAGKDTEADDDVYFAEDFDWLNRVAKALDYLADKDLRHGDVKPTNILFREDKQGQLQAYLSDIEIPKPRGNKKAGQNRDEYPGTMAYLAREVFLDRENASSRSDQYSLAVTLYEWLAGELPFKGITGIDMYKAFQKGCQPITKFCPDLPATAADALHRALADEPEQRFETTGDFVSAFVESLPLKSKSPLFNLQTLSTAFLAVAASVLLLTVGNWMLGKFGQVNVPAVSNQVATQPTPELPKKGQNPIPIPPTKSPELSPPASSEKAPWSSLSRESQPAFSLKTNNRRNPAQTPRVENVQPQAEKEETPQQKFDRYFDAVQRGVLEPKQVFELAKMFENGEGTAPKFQQAFSIYGQLAQRGLPSAQFKLAQLFQNGTNAGGERVLNPDPRRSLHWYQKAAENGHADAQFWMGQYFEKGDQTQRGLQQAYNWYAKAALQGNPDYSTHVADFCGRFGQPERARHWQAKADQQKNEFDQKAKQTTEKCETDMVK